MHAAQFKMIARSVGYRMGKSAAEREKYRKKDEYMPDFRSLFVEELVQEAETGYDEGMKFVRTGKQTFHEGRIKL